MDRLEDVEHAKFRALAQMMVEVGAENHEKGIEAFEDYMRRAFPGLENKKKKKEELVKQQLKWWVGRGPLKITPQAGFEKKGKSRMIHRIQQVETGARSKLYSRLKPGHV